jgi:hypothetical protein
MIGELGQHRPQLPASQDEHPIKQLTANGAHTLRVPDIRYTSCDLRVLMDEPTESISSRDASRRPDDR